LRAQTKSTKQKKKNKEAKQRPINFSQLVTRFLLLYFSYNQGPNEIMKIIFLYCIFSYSYTKKRIAFRFLYLGWHYNGFAVQDNTSNTIEVIRIVYYLQSLRKNNFVCTIFVI